MRNDPQALQLLKILLSGPASGIAPDYAAIKALLSSSDGAWFPTRYETQMDIPPGDYNLEVVLSGEEKFGRAEALHNTTELSASCFPSRILKCSSTVAEF
jgi:hypothetical protein